LLLSNQTWNELNEILTVHQQFFAWDSLGIAKQKRIASSQQCFSALSLIQAEDRSLFVHIKQAIAFLEKSGLSPKRLVTGHTLLEEGIAPCSAMGTILEAVYDSQLEGIITTRDQAITLALAIYKDFLDS